MKVSYPLSLKVSLWLILNLLLLAGLGLGFLVVRGGLSWDALVAGPTGDRMQSLANVIAGEAAAATGEARTAVLKRFSAVYRADFFLFSSDEGQIAGVPVDPPSLVRVRLESRFGRGGAGGFGIRSDFRRSDNMRRREPPEKTPADSDERLPQTGVEKSPAAVPDALRREAPPFVAPLSEARTGRFVVHTGLPSAYWVGFRVPFVTNERGRPTPTRVLVRVGSLWGLLHLLNLQSWVLAGGGVLVLSVIFWLPLVGSITRSVSQLTAATEQIAEGRFETRITARRHDELGKLGDSVNRMATRLDAHMTDQKRFLGDVAHELCSPLARLQMAMGILQEQAPKNLQDTVADVREEVQQMSALVNELLAFTKAGLRPRDVVCVTVELAALVESVVAREDINARVTVHVPAPLNVSAEPELLGRALGNLVRNALRYAGDAGPIVLNAQREGGRVIVTLDDHGPGVPPGDLDRLGEPFFRPELARTREGGGAGLGLAIVRNSVAACGGDVRFSNRTPRGFRVEIRLNAA